jgi:hypothetical protein
MLQLDDDLPFCVGCGPGYVSFYEASVVLDAPASTPWRYCRTPGHPRSMRARNLAAKNTDRSLNCDNLMRRTPVRRLRLLAPSPGVSHYEQ